MSTPQKSNSSKKSKKWRAPDPELEARMLGNTEGDWKLPAAGQRQLGRTRGASTRSGIDPKDLFCREVQIVASINDESSIIAGDNSSAASSLTNSISTASSSKRKYWKPAATRVIIKVNPAKTLFQKYLSNTCPVCSSSLELTFPTVCVSSGIRLECTNKGMCTYVDLATPAGSDIPLADDAGSQKITRNTDSALNILYVLGFIASGDGGTEASRILGLLGLPNSTTMQGCSFGNIEREISPVIQEYTAEIIMSNLKREVALKFGDQLDENNRLLYDRWINIKLQITHHSQRSYGTH